ncbi:hypothetical protein [Nocardioides houyundeii]|uniref:hypothetical protein n=1 Tax=Nocardioides houyundeii TaxID=2045452 RepID=UPI000DF2894F|nr:hypothetical protein [Nocardioides houyundeii]
MSTPVRLAAFLIGLVVAFAVATGIGRAVGPLDVAVEEHSTDDAAHGDTSTTDEDGHEDGHEEGAHQSGPAAGSTVPGLVSRQDGFALRLASPEARAGRQVPLSFTVETSSGRPLLDYQTVHERDLHLIVVRRDLTGFQHVHPTLDRRTGTWSTALDLTPGTWRVIADFTPQGWDGLTLADDLFVPGDFRPEPELADRRTDSVAGYDVSLRADAAPGVDTVVSLTVQREERPVTDLSPYLGASGHLVAIRSGDLGYLHVHPEEGSSGPRIDFATTFPTAGVYRLFLDFKHRGAVHTADFTVVAGGAPQEAPAHDH